MYQDHCFDDKGQCNLAKALLYLNSHKSENILQEPMITLSYLGYPCSYCRAYAKGEDALLAIKEHLKKHISVVQGSSKYFTVRDI